MLLKSSAKRKQPYLLVCRAVSIMATINIEEMLVQAQDPALPPTQLEKLWRLSWKNAARAGIEQVRLAIVQNPNLSMSLTRRILLIPDFSEEIAKNPMWVLLLLEDPTLEEERQKALRILKGEFNPTEGKDP